MRKVIPFAQNKFLLRIGYNIHVQVLVNLLDKCNVNLKKWHSHTLWILCDVLYTCMQHIKTTDIEIISYYKVMEFMIIILISLLGVYGWVDSK